MDPVLVMFAIVVVAILCLVGVGVYGWLAWRRPLGSDAVMPLADGASATRHGSSELVGPRFFAETSDRVVRVLTLIFLASVGVAVFLTGDYSSTTAMAIELLIAGALLTIVLLQDIVPIKDPRIRYWLEAVSAIVFLALLTYLTGGASSPFFVGFLLVVAGASLSLDETAPLVLAVLAGASFAIVVVARNTADFFSVLPTLAFDLVVLALLAYLAAAVAREQRRGREAALGLSRVDALTGLSNRAGIVDAVEREISRSDRSRRPFAMLMFDLDNLKPVNDQLGHQAGDDLLRSIADAVRRSVRTTDVAGRYGGDEFVVLLGDTDAAGAETKAERLRAEIASIVAGSADRPARTTASFGLVTFPDDGRTVEELIENADLAMYQAKRGGKNQIVGYVRRTRPLSKAPDDADEEPLARAGDRRSGGPRQPAPTNDGAGADPLSAPTSDAAPSAAESTTSESGAGESRAAEGSSSDPLGVAVDRAPWDSTTPPPASETRRLGNRRPR